MALWRQVIPAAGAALAYAIASALDGSGFIGAFVAGMVFRAVIKRDPADINQLTEEVGNVLNGVTFVLFGAILLGPALGELSWELVLYAVLSLTIVRMVPVAIAMLGSRARLPTLAFVGWFGPRGLASIVFAVILIEESALPHEHLILLAIYLTVGLSVFAHGLTAAPLADRYADWFERHPRDKAPPMESAPTEVTRTRGPLQPGAPVASTNPEVTNVIPLVMAFRGLARAMAAVWRDPETKALPVVAGVLLLTGTLFYWRFEDWSIIQSLYFCVVTLTTVGFGDLTPDQRRNAAVHDLLHPHRPRDSRRPAGFGRRALHRAEVRAHQRPRALARAAGTAPRLEGGGTAIALQVHPFGAMTAPPAGSRFRAIDG